RRQVDLPAARDEHRPRESRVAVHAQPGHAAVGKDVEAQVGGAGAGRDLEGVGRVAAEGGPGEDLRPRRVVELQLRGDAGELARLDGAVLRVVAAEEARVDHHAADDAGNAQAYDAPV